MTGAFNEVIIRDQSYLFFRNDMVFTIGIPAFLRGAVICYIDHFFWFLLDIIIWSDFVLGAFFPRGAYYTYTKAQWIILKRAKRHKKRQEMR